MLALTPIAGLQVRGQQRFSRAQPQAAKALPGPNRVANPGSQQPTITPDSTSLTNMPAAAEAHVWGFYFGGGDSESHILLLSF